MNQPLNQSISRSAKRGIASAVCVGFLLCGCSGEGSDIGPTLPELPKATCKAVVLDDLGRGVVGATVSAGGPAPAVTGRNGRTDLFADPRGRVLVAIDGANAAAAAGDRLGSLRVATTVIGPDLPNTFYLPELPDSASATLTLGTQVVTTTITSTAGGVLSVPAGCSVGLPGPAVTVTVRAGVLQGSHLPGDLPTSLAGAILFGRGFAVDPPSVTFAPAADLDVADDLLLGAATASLYRLDDTTGEWTVVATGITSTGGRLVVPGAVAVGGLYAFGAVVAATIVSGRVVDPATVPLPLPDVMVNVDHRKVLTDGAGRFVATDVAATFADGSPRQATIELFAGGIWMPARFATTVPVLAAPVDVGLLALDTLLAGNVRVQQVVRGRADPLRESRISTIFGDVALATTSDANGQLFFEDVPSEWFGFQDGRPIDSAEVFYGQAIAFLQDGRRWFDIYQFSFERPWYVGARSTLAIVTDALGGGPLMDAVVVQGSIAGQGFVGKTLESGTFAVTRDFAGRATASRRSQRAGRTIVHAFSIERPDGEHLELPLQRVLRAPLGAFDRHGLVAGTVTGADAGRDHRLRVTRRLSRQEWWQDVAEGAPIPSSLPIDVDPATTHAEFQAGLAVAGGNLAAVELATVGPLTTLLKAGIVADVVPIEGGVVPRDIALDLEATTPFVVDGAFLGASADIDRTSLTFALALQQPSGRVVDVARGLSYNDVPGLSLSFLLPDLTGSLQGNQWLVLLQGSKVSGGATLSHSSLISLPRPAPPIGVFVLPGDFPTITSPAPGATVPASGFTVQFGLPQTAIYGTIELRSDEGGELLLWQATVPGTQTAGTQRSFSFVQLPTEAVTPLKPGRTWSLTVTAAFRSIEVVPDIFDPYRDQATFLQSIGTAERGVRVVASRTITITTN